MRALLTYVLTISSLANAVEASGVPSLMRLRGGNGMPAGPSFTREQRRTLDDILLRTEQGVWCCARSSMPVCVRQHPQPRAETMCSMLTQARRSSGNVFAREAVQQQWTPQ